MLAVCRWQWFAAGETISLGGDVAGGMFGIVVGSISVFPTISAADVPIVHIASAPFWYGLNPQLSSAPRIMTIVARSRCLVARVSQPGLEAVLADDPARWRFIARQLNDIVILSQLVASDMLIRDSRRRCLAVLLRIAGCRLGEAAMGTAEMTQDELASMANLSRQTIGPILNEFAEAGLLTLGYRSIALHDAAALRKLVDL